MDSDEYTWEFDRLTKIHWNPIIDDVNGGYLKEYNLNGDISFSSFAKLRELYCYHNQLNSLDVSQNANLRDLSCDNEVTIIGEANRFAEY